MSWMDQNINSDVQTALQSQTIQTALEANTSRITDAGFQSFLTNAPIPRFYYDTVTGTYTTGLETTFNFTTANALDPYSLFTPANGTLRIPIDGFYSLNIGLIATGGAAGFAQLQWRITTAGAGALQAQNLVYATAGNASYQLNLNMLRPYRQGTVLFPSTTNGTVANWSGMSAYVSGSWIAPYNQYTIGAGGN